MSTLDVTVDDEHMDKVSMLPANGQPSNSKSHPRYDALPRCISANYICWYTIMFPMSILGIWVALDVSSVCGDQTSYVIPLNVWLLSGCILLLITSIIFLCGYCFLRCCSPLSLFDRMQRILWSSMTTRVHSILSLFFIIWSIFGFYIFTNQMNERCQNSMIGNIILLFSILQLMNICWFCCCCAPFINCYGTLRCLRCCTYYRKRNGKFRLSKETIVDYCPECVDEEYLMAHPYIKVGDLDKIPSIKFREMDAVASRINDINAKRLATSTLNDLLKEWRTMFNYTYSNGFQSQPPLKYNTIVDNIYLNDDIRFAVIAHKSASIDKGIILYTHGGGYIAGSHRDDLPMLSFLSELTGCIAISIDYKLCPEYSLMGCVNDGLAVYKWICDVDGVRSQNHGNISSHCPDWLMNIDGNEIHKRCVFAGDSAGGGLCLRLLQAVNADDSVHLPCCAWAISPWTKLSGFGKRENNGLDSLISQISIDAMAKICSRNFESEKDTLITKAIFGNVDDAKYSPFNGDVKGLCPIYMSVGASEILLDDTLMFAEKAYNEGVEVQVEIEPYMFHIYPTHNCSFPEAKHAVIRASEFIRRQLEK